MGVNSFKGGALLVHPQASITRELHPKIPPSVLQHELPWKPLFVSGPVVAILNRGFQGVALLKEQVQNQHQHEGKRGQKSSCRF